MSDSLLHECGIALIRVKNLQILENQERFALVRMMLLMEKLHNRGQDGAGLAAWTPDTCPGFPVISRVRSVSVQPIREIFDEVENRIRENRSKHEPFLGPLLLGHLRYATYGKKEISACHPFLREHAHLSQTLALAGNFNLTNTPELLKLLQTRGVHLTQGGDTSVVTAWLGECLDRHNLLEDALKAAFPEMDGGFVMGGITGNGSAFVVRDAHGIRPAYVYEDENFWAVASERPALQTVFDLDSSQVQELPPGHAAISHADGSTQMIRILPEAVQKSCSFERIYFSRGTDAEIYQERKNLGRALVPKLLKKLGPDLDHAVFSFIPNTAELAFYGLMQGLESEMLKCSEQNKRSADGLPWRPRVEKLLVKDAKLRTFITDHQDRDALVQHIYDVSYGCIKPGEDVLVVLDDSIVRGTTLKQSILRMLDRLGPRKILILSSAPQIRYPDCYGIDMARLSDLLAFQAVVELYRESGRSAFLDDTAAQIRKALKENIGGEKNYVQPVYSGFSDEEICQKMAALVKPMGLKAEVALLFQDVADLNAVCRQHAGDWYFTGNYPTPGGNRISNQAFLDFMENRNRRAYD